MLIMRIGNVGAYILLCISLYLLNLLKEKAEK